MIRPASLLILVALFAQAQQKPPDALEALRQTADRADAEWEMLAKGLEQKIATLLPCDPKSREAVETVSHASEARLTALSAYLRAAAARARQDTEAAKSVLAAQAALSGGWNTEYKEAEEERAAIESQVADLKESMRKRGALAGAEKVLVQIATMVKQRAGNSDEEAGRKDSIDSLLGDLVLAYQNRQTALEKESSLLDAEVPKWNAYYSTRVSRAITECTIISPTAAPRKKQQ